MSDYRQKTLTILDRVRMDCCVEVYPSDEHAPLRDHVESALRAAHEAGRKEAEQAAESTRLVWTAQDAPIAGPYARAMKEAILDAIRALPDSRPAGEVKP